MQTTTWNTLPKHEVIEQTAAALTANGMNTRVVENGDIARQEVMAMIPDGASVMNVTSATVDQIGLAGEIAESTRFEALRKKITSLPQAEMRAQMRRAGSVADVVVGSIHALTQDGKAVVVSGSGSQLAPYAFSAGKVIWVVGAQKIVKNLDEAMKRIQEHTLPLESERMQKLYGRGSAIAKVLIFNREGAADRVNIFIVKQVLGF
jgi:L-lactate utilization protein LutC